MRHPVGCSLPEDHTEYDYGAQARLDDEPLEPSKPEGWHDLDEQLHHIDA
jgi:hypothetical protein